MLTGEIRNQVDRIWDAFWSGGVSNPLSVIEQITGQPPKYDPVVSQWFGVDGVQYSGAWSGAEWD